MCIDTCSAGLTYQRPSKYLEVGSVGFNSIALCIRKQQHTVWLCITYNKIQIY